MNRRSFVGFVTAALATIAALPSVLLSGPRKHGRVSVFDESYRPMSVRAWLDGVEVTNECQIADDIEGYVVCLKRGTDGKHYVDHSIGEVATERLTGDVVIKQWVSNS